MFTKHDRSAARHRRHRRVRKTVIGTAARPRLAIFRSLHHIAVQVIDDERGHTLVSASTHEPALRSADGKSPNVRAAALIGRTVAERAIAAGIRCVAFDRGGYPYPGRVQSLADAAREAGLEF